MFPSDIEPTPAPRLLFFSHDTVGLGHLRRSTAIAHECSARIPDASILYVTGSLLPTCFALPPRCDVVKLPVLTKDSLGRYVPGALDVTLDLAVSLRRGLAFEAVRRFDPHVVLVDHAPLGAAAELRPALEWLRSHRPGTRVILGMRDVLDAPQRVETEFGADSLQGLIRRYFDEVLVYGDPRVFDPVTAYGFDPDVAAKVRFAGYVATEPAATQPRHVAKPRIVVTSGGGCDGLYVHDAVLDALAGPLADCDVAVEMTLGPLSDETRRDQVLERARGDRRIDAAVFRPELGRTLKDADVVIAMAGANTVAEILAADRPAILLPRSRPRLEQKLRAERLEALGLARVVDPDSPTAVDQLGAYVRKALAGELLPRMRLRPRTDGARNVAEHLRRAVGGEWTRKTDGSATAPQLLEGHSNV